MIIISIILLFQVFIPYVEIFIMLIFVITSFFQVRFRKASKVTDIYLKL